MQAENPSPARGPHLRIRHRFQGFWVCVGGRTAGTRPGTHTDRIGSAPQRSVLLLASSEGTRTGALAVVAIRGSATECAGRKTRRARGDQDVRNFPPHEPPWEVVPSPNRCKLVLKSATPPPGPLSSRPAAGTRMFPTKTRRRRGLSKTAPRPDERGGDAHRFRQADAVAVDAGGEGAGQAARKRRVEEDEDAAVVGAADQHAAPRAESPPDPARRRCARGPHAAARWP